MLLFDYFMPASIYADIKMRAGQNLEEFIGRPNPYA